MNFTNLLTKTGFKSFTVLANTGNYEYLTILTNINRFRLKCNINPNLDQPNKKLQKKQNKY